MTRHVCLHSSEVYCTASAGRLQVPLLQHNHRDGVAFESFHYYMLGCIQSSAKQWVYMNGMIGLLKNESEIACPMVNIKGVFEVLWIKKSNGAPCVNCWNVSVSA